MAALNSVASIVIRGLASDLNILVNQVLTCLLLRPIV